MRQAFVEVLEELAALDDRIVLLSGDIGNRMFDRFQELYPKRFYNCGIAEANMTGMAAGLALAGFKPITYCITAFNTLRCLEQIRLDLCFHNLPVMVVGVGGGLSYASLNPSHHALEDIAALRAFPNLNILCPADALETKACFREGMALGKPVYLRLGKKNEPVIHQEEPKYKIGQALPIKSGKDICLIVNGILLPNVIKAVELIENQNLSCQIYSYPSVKPIDVQWIESIFNQFPKVISIEEHARSGGFGSALSEIYIQKARHCAFKIIGTGDFFIHNNQDQEGARKVFGLDPKNLAESILNP